MIPCGRKLKNLECLLLDAEFFSSPESGFKLEYLICLLSMKNVFLYQNFYVSFMQILDLDAILVEKEKKKENNLFSTLINF